MDITKLIKNKQKTPTRKTIIPWHCQKRYQASLNQLSFNQTITTACFSRKVAALLSNNKLLARELANNKCDSNEKENLLLDNVKYGDIINFSRLKLLDAAENLKKVTSTLDETVTMLQLVQNPPKIKPFKVNYNKEFKKRLKATVNKDTSTIEEEEVTVDEQHNPSETSEQKSGPKISRCKGKIPTFQVPSLEEPSTENTKKCAMTTKATNVKTDNKKQKTKNQAKTNASKNEKSKKNSIVTKNCQFIETVSSTIGRKKETFKNSKKKNKHEQLFWDVINDVSEAVIPKLTKTKTVTTLSPTEVSSSSSDETATNSETSSEGDSGKTIPSAEKQSTNNRNEKYSQNSDEIGVIKKPIHQYVIKRVSSVKNIKVSNNMGESGEPTVSNCYELENQDAVLKTKGIFKQTHSDNSCENRNIQGSCKGDAAHRRVQFAFQDEQHIEKVSANKRNPERVKQKLPKKRPLKENKQNIPSNDNTGTVSKKPALQYPVEDPQMLPDNNKILVIAEVHQPPVCSQVSESCSNIYSQNLQPLVVLKDIFKFKEEIDICPSIRDREGCSSTEKEEDAVTTVQPSPMNVENEVQVIDCKFNNQENNLTLGNNLWGKKSSRREGKNVTSYKEPTLNKKMRRC